MKAVDTGFGAGCRRALIRLGPWDDPARIIGRTRPETSSWMLGGPLVIPTENPHMAYRGGYVDMPTPEQAILALFEMMLGVTSNQNAH